MNRYIRRAACLITVAAAGLAPVVPVAASARGIAQGTNRCLTVTATIRLGSQKYPTGVAVDPKTNIIYAAELISNGGRVSVINGQTNTVTATHPAF